MEWETLIHLHKDSDYRRKDSDPTEISLVKGYEHYYFFFCTPLLNGGISNRKHYPSDLDDSGYRERL